MDAAAFETLDLRAVDALDAFAPTAPREAAPADGGPAGRDRAGAARVPPQAGAPYGGAPHSVSAQEAGR
ncbi:hypothetical protein D3C83_139740 [compost metagenome]